MPCGGGRHDVGRAVAGRLHEDAVLRFVAGLQLGAADQRERPGLAQPVPSFRIRLAAFAPGPPVMPPPGCAPEPHRYRPSKRKRYRASPSIGRHAKN